MTDCHPPRGTRNPDWDSPETGDGQRSFASPRNLRLSRAGDAKAEHCHSLPHRSACATTQAAETGAMVNYCITQSLLCSVCSGLGVDAGVSILWAVSRP